MPARQNPPKGRLFGQGSCVTGSHHAFPCTMMSRSLLSKTHLLDAALLGQEIKTPGSAIKLLSSEDDKSPAFRRNPETQSERPLETLFDGSIEDQDVFLPSGCRDNDANLAFPEDMPLAEILDRISPQGKAKEKRRRIATNADKDFDFSLSQLTDETLRNNQDCDDLELDPLSQDTTQKSPKRKRGTKLTQEQKDEREALKKKEKAEKLQAREAKKREKEVEKEQKKLQREHDRLHKKRESGKTALVDGTIFLDPNLAKHRLGRDIMQKLEDMYGVPGVEGPCVEISKRLPLWPHRCATWSRKIYPLSTEDILSQTEGVLQQVPYHMIFFSAEEFVNQIMLDDLSSVVQNAAKKCSDSTLAILIEGLEHYLVQRQRKDFQANGPGNGGFNRAFVDEFLGRLPCKYPGIRHVIVPDSASAAEHVAGLTRAIAEQPFHVETAYVMSFGAGKPDTQAMAELLKKAPLPHKDRETWFKALNNIPRLGPQAAHATCGSFASLGSLIQTYKAPRQAQPKHVIKRSSCRLSQLPEASANLKHPELFAQDYITSHLHELAAGHRKPMNKCCKTLYALEADGLALQDQALYIKF